MKKLFTPLVALTMFVCCCFTLTTITSNAFAANANASLVSNETTTKPNPVSVSSFPVSPIVIGGLTVAPTCYGGSNGSINITVTGGVLPYSYLWSNGVTSEDLNGIVAGSYSVTVTDAAGTTKAKSMNVASAIIIQGYTTCNRVCYASCNGTIDLTMMNGTAPFTYHWSNNATTEDLINLCAGVYSVTVTDANGCTKLISAQIQSYTQIILAVAKTDLNCNGQCIGAMDLTVSGGTAPYTYAWSNGATTQDILGLCAGPYSVTVTDFNGCSKVKSLNILQPLQLGLSLTPNIIPCYSVCSGTINATVTGGTAPYTFNWSNSATIEDLSGVCAGDYSLTVTDAKGCSIPASTTVLQPQSPLSASTVTTDVNCNTTCGGTIDLTVTGGTAPYTYVWSNGATTEDRTGLCLGFYCVTITDANQCQAIKCAIINQTIPPVVSLTGTNLVCNGQCNGSADLTIVSENAPFTFSWNNGETTEDLSGLCAGEYCVTVTDVNGCTASACITITQPDVMLCLVHCENHPLCHDACTGYAQTTIAGGTAPFSYYWNTASTEDELENLCEGLYCVTVTDANGCTCESCVFITAPTTLEATINSNNVSCNNLCNGTATVTANGGTAPYTYLWYNGTTNANVNGLCAGQYCVTVYDSHLCSLVKCVNISQPDELTAITNQSNNSCFQSCNGTASVTANSGTAPYTYLWYNGTTNANVSGLCADQYCVTVYDAHQCSIVKCVTITQPDVLGATTNQSNNSCFLSCNGTASVTAFGGTAPYSYFWYNGNTNSSINGLCAGQYCVTVYDAHQCSIVKCVTITQPYEVSASIIGTDASICINPNCNGLANLSVSGGTAPYTYLWSNGATTEDVSGLCPGTYSVTVKDANLCPKTAWVTINCSHICNIYVTGYILNIGCGGNCNGSINITVSNATSPTYHWSNGATTEDVNGLCAGTYTVTVTDAYQCSAIQSFTVNQNAPIIVTIISVNNTNCNSGCCNGTASASATGGVAPYTYHWSTSSNNANISSLCAGTYTVTVTDASGCTKTASVCITCVTPCVLTLTGVSTNVSCNGGNNGSIDLSVSGGSNYTYHWNNNATTQDINGLAAGSYSVTVTSAGGCSGVKSFTICQPSAICASVSGYNTCYGSCNGIADLTVSGGTAPYSYHWSNNASTQDLCSLCAGTYSVTVTDANLCSVVKTVCIVSNSQIVVTITSTNNTNCNGGCCNGTASASATGGVAPYTYHWSNSSNNANISSLCAGTYTVTVTDAAGCTKTASVCITCVTPCVLTLSGVVTNVSCNGGNNGSIDFTVTGGSNYTYHWNNNATTQDISGLAAGSYSVTVTSAGGCSGVKSFTICQPSAICASVSGYNTCYGSCNGIADLTVSGGTAPYSYHWSNNASTQDLCSLCAGTYSVTVTDANLCSVVKTVCIVSNSQIVVTITSTNNTNCNGGCCNGTASASASGGTAPYSYHWSTGSNCANITALCAGTYTVTVTDAAGCTKTASVCITCVTPCVLTLSGVVTNVSCNGGSNGAIDLSVGGGSNYTYHWNNNASTQDRTCLSAGTYSVTVTAAAGCSGVISFTVCQPTAICGSICATNTCNGQSTGAADLTVSGGTAPYSYHWSNGSTHQDITCLCAGCYSVTITDANQCSLVKSVNIYSVSCGCDDRNEEGNTILTSTTNTELNLNIYPNPVNAQTTFEFVASQDVDAVLEIYTVTGVKIAEIYNGQLLAGNKYTFVYNANELVAGMYFARLKTNNGTVIQNITKIK